MSIIIIIDHYDYQDPKGDVQGHLDSLFSFLIFCLMVYLYTFLSTDMIQSIVKMSQFVLDQGSRQKKK